MATNFFTAQRGIIASLLTAPVQPGNLIGALPDDPDAELIGHWNNRQRALAEIESKGSFFDCENNAPEASEAFDTAECYLHVLPAKTARGAALKLWSALAHTGDGFTVRNKLIGDILRRAVLAEVENIQDELEYPQQSILNVIRSLAALSVTKEA